MNIQFQKSGFKKSVLCALASVCILTACADAEGPKARDTNIPAPQNAETRRKAVNERPDPIMYLPLGEDVLLPESDAGQPLPSTVVGPFELRSETLAGALQLILDGTDIPVSFETTKGLENTITVTNLKGPINEVVQQVCGLADLYCSYQNGVLNVKDTQIFTVSIPPIVAADQVGQLMTNVSGAIGEITGSAPITDPSTRTIVYRATERTAEVARRYFQRLRQNTAMIVFETYIWEVSLNAGNSTGINWSYFDSLGRFSFGLNAIGSLNPDLGTPVSIGLPTTGNTNFSTGDVVKFISNYGAVKTISQPQITVLAGSEARLRIADTQNYLASVSRTTTDGGTTTTSTTTDSVDSGFTLVIGSNWDNATVYGNINILLQEVKSIDKFEASAEATVQLPSTSERELQTQVRVRPGDSLLIAGLVRERDNLDTHGPGTSEPIIPTDRTAQTNNVELVFLLKPRVIVFTSSENPAPKIADVPKSVLKAEVQNEIAKKDAISAVQPPAIPEPVQSQPVAPIENAVAKKKIESVKTAVKEKASPSSKPMPLIGKQSTLTPKVDKVAAEPVPLVTENQPAAGGGVPQDIVADEEIKAPSKPKASRISSSSTPVGGGMSTKSSNAATATIVANKPVGPLDSNAYSDKGGAN